MHQVLIVSKPVVNKSKRGADLLIEHLLPPPVKLFQQLAGKPKLKKRLRKRACIKNKIQYNNSVKVEALNENPIVR